MSTKDSLRRLVDALPDSELEAARRFLEYLQHTFGPLLWKLLEAPEGTTNLPRLKTKPWLRTPGRSNFVARHAPGLRSVKS